MSVLQDDEFGGALGVDLETYMGAVCWYNRNLCAGPGYVLSAPDTAHHLPRLGRFLSVTVNPLGV